MNNNPDSHEISSGGGTSFERIFSRAVLVLTVAVVGIYLSRPLYDPDFYWHLKTGQWIWQNRSLPHADFFGIPPLPELSPRTEFIYTSYWLLQLILYGLYAMAGMSGIILFRWLIAGIYLTACACWSNLRNSNVAAVLAIGLTLLLELYFIERPQFVSFLFFGIILVLLFRFLEQRTPRSLWKTLVPLSLSMIVWANMHGGFLIGQAILLYCVAAEGAKFFHSSLSPLSGRGYKILLISSATALAASCINPNPLNLIKYLPIIFDASHYSYVNNLEELSVFAYFREVRDYTILFYIASIALTFAALLFSRYRRDITWVGILVGTAFMGCLHMRLMPFFLVTAMLFMAKYFETEPSARKGRLILLFMLVVTTVHGVRDEFPRIREAATSGWVPVTQFPVKAADFITANNIGGNIYSTMYWGGYMIWRMGPDNRLFYDGRTLDMQRAFEYNNSRIIAVNQRPYWKGLFDAYNIRIIILPIYEDDGQPSLLTQSINADKEWTIVFASETEVVFVRNDSRGSSGPARVK